MPDFSTGLQGKVGSDWLHQDWRVALLVETVKVAAFSVLLAGIASAPDKSDVNAVRLVHRSAVETGEMNDAVGIVQGRS